MQSHWVNGAPYYRCRFPAEYALANRVQHPLNVNTLASTAPKQAVLTTGPALERGFWHPLSVNASGEPAGSFDGKPADVADDVPELKQLLLDLAQERDRCLKYGAQLSAWAMFWTLALVAVGAVVAAQGAFTRIWGNDSWISVTFIVLGVFTSLGSGFQSAFKPGIRSPQFAEIGLEYDRLARSLRRDAAAIRRSYDLSVPDRAASFLAAMDDLLNRADEQLRAVQDKELGLYVTGPVTIRRAVGPTRGRWAGWPFR